MTLKSINSFKPDSYLPSVYDINYLKLHENGIRYAVFDVDSTILPFDDTKVTDKCMSLFNDIKDIGITPALCSSGFIRRVKPVAEVLEVNYMARASKPFVSFERIKKLFDINCEAKTTMYVGDSLLFDMTLARKIKMYKVLVDMIREGSRVKIFANDALQAFMYISLKKEGFQFQKYYRGYMER